GLDRVAGLGLGRRRKTRSRQVHRHAVEVWRQLGHEVGPVGRRAGHAVHAQDPGGLRGVVPPPGGLGDGSPPCEKARRIVPPRRHSPGHVHLLAGAQRHHPSRPVRNRTCHADALRRPEDDARLADAAGLAPPPARLAPPASLVSLVSLARSAFPAATLARRISVRSAGPDGLSAEMPGPPGRTRSLPSILAWTSASSASRYASRYADGSKSSVIVSISEAAILSSCDRTSTFSSRNL